MVIGDTEEAVGYLRDILRTRIFRRHQLQKNFVEIAHTEFPCFVAEFDSLEFWAILDKPELCVMVIPLDWQENTVGRNI